MGFDRLKFEWFKLMLKIPGEWGRQLEQLIDVLTRDGTG